MRIRGSLVLVGAVACVSACGGNGSHSGTGASLPGPRSAPAASHSKAGPGGPRGPASTPSAPATSGTPAPGSYDDTSGSGRSPATQRDVLAHLPGRTSGCVPVGAGHTLRSGSVAMGDFAAARAAFAHTDGKHGAAPSHFYVIPESRAARQARVSATPAGGGAAVVARSHGVASAAQWHYLPVELRIDRPGAWRLHVTAGHTHGCFLVTFRG